MVHLNFGQDPFVYAYPSQYIEDTTKSNQILRLYDQQIRWNQEGRPDFWANSLANRLIVEMGMLPS